MKNTLLIYLLAAGLTTTFAQPLRVRVVAKGNGYQLLVNNRPYYVNGFVGASQFALAKEYGANSVRTGASERQLDEAQKYGFTALTNLHLPGERDGMDWNNDARKDSLLRLTLSGGAPRRPRPCASAGWAPRPPTAPRA